jgi:hypothetical protein
MTAGEFKAKARKLANAAGMRGATIWAFGDDPKAPDTAGIRSGTRQLSMLRPSAGGSEAAAYRMILAGIKGPAGGGIRL